VYIFIDESGDLGANKVHEYFIIGMIFCENQSIVDVLNQTIKNIISIYGKMAG